LDLSMAALALDSGLHVPHVLELHVLGEIVDAHPGDRASLRAAAERRRRLTGSAVELLDLGDLFAASGRRAFLYELMTAPAHGYGGQGGGLPLVCPRVAIAAVDLHLAGVKRVAEIDRLRRAILLVAGQRVQAGSLQSETGESGANEAYEYSGCL